MLSSSLLLAMVQLVVSTSIDVDAAPSPWMDQSLPIPQRVSLLLKTLSVEQKIAQTWAPYSGSMKSIQDQAAVGIGAVSMSIVSHEADTATTISRRNALQASFTSKSTVPISFFSEGLHGGANKGTVFPMPVNQGCSWNTSLVQAIASAIAAEARSIGTDTVFAPVVNMWSDPRFGRLQEGFSDNPLITTHMGTASVIGLQHGAKQLEYLDNTSVRGCVRACVRA